MSLPGRAVIQSKGQVHSKLSGSSGRVSAEQAAVASGRGATMGPRPPPVEPPLKKIGTDTLDEYLEKKERQQKIKREILAKVCPNPVKKLWA